MDCYGGLASLLTAYFCNEFYEEGIRALRRDIERQMGVALLWQHLVAAIHKRAFLSGQPLELVNYKANQILDENTDEEAYRWLDLMVANVRRSDSAIWAYPEVNRDIGV